MKRLSLVLVLALALTIAFAGAALAEQKSIGPGTGNGTGGVTGVNPNAYTATTDTTYITDAVYWNIYTSYPVPTDGNPINGIYLPPDNVVRDPLTKTGRIHTNFTKNTDACAACHATHSGVGGKLLQWETTTRTCVACHDGTLANNYNIIGGYIGATTKRTFGGLFPAATAGSDWSRHAVFDSVKNNAAPGGARYQTAADDSKGKWTSEFSCASCHSPHGQGGNARLLSADPNGVATLGKKAGFTLTSTGGVTFVAYNGTAASGNEYTWIRGYPYSVQTQVYNGGGAPLSASAYTVDNNAGYTVVTIPGYTTGTVTANFIPAVSVKMSIANFLKSTESVTYRSGVNEFCGACHTDYNVASEASGKNLTGYYTNAYRHRVGMNWHAPGAPGLAFEPNYKVVCLTCHVAHGTDKQYRIDTLAGIESGYWTSATVGEARGDGKSALKRKPNMGTCETCHKKGDGNQGYTANSQ